jgi:hypothetical protein
MLPIGLENLLEIYEIIKVRTNGITIMQMLIKKRKRSSHYLTFPIKIIIVSRIEVKIGNEREVFIKIDSIVFRRTDMDLNFVKQNRNF